MRKSLGETRKKVAEGKSLKLFSVFSVKMRIFSSFHLNYNVGSVGVRPTTAL